MNPVAEQKKVHSRFLFLNTDPELLDTGTLEAGSLDCLVYFNLVLLADRGDVHITVASEFWSSIMDALASTALSRNDSLLAIVGAGLVSVLLHIPN